MNSNNDLVWYVCYGSNLSLERFMCYLTGNGSLKYKVKANPNRAFKDQSLPRDSKRVSIPYELYFALYSSNWNGAVAFLDKDTKGDTIGRAYLITKEQYEHVKYFEGSSYQYEIELEPINGVRVLTFTHETRIVDNNKVSKEYRFVIEEGLKELGLSESEIESYLNQRIK